MGKIKTFLCFLIDAVFLVAGIIVATSALKRGDDEIGVITLIVMALHIRLIVDSVNDEEESQRKE